jgi:D-lactate dehydrogenase (cytochrome)
MTHILRGEAMEPHRDLLKDESRLQGTADAIALPGTEAELVQTLLEASRADQAVTVSAGRTGITGAGVPDGGMLLCTAHMNRATGLRRDGDELFVRVQPGITLDALREAIASAEFPGAEAWDASSRAALEALREGPPRIFPPDPTETSACIGGMVACNASGARSFHWGPTRPYVNALRGVLVDGRSFDLARGQVHADGTGAFALPLEDGTRIKGTIPSYAMPASKNAAGYYAEPGMDLVDLFIGSEGTLAILTGIELKLVAAPEAILGAVCFTPDEAAALRLVHLLRGDTGEPPAPRPLAMEFFGHRALALLRSPGSEALTRDLPPLPEACHTAVYLEYAGSPEATEEAMLAVGEAMETLGADPEATWIADSGREHARLKDFRHAVPELVNTRIGEYKRDCPAITKLGTDMAVADAHLDTMLARYRADVEAAGLDYVIFGHIGDNHVHVNILPRTEAEYEAGKALYRGFAEQAVAWGGTISAEHGIGKLKSFLLPVLYGEDGVDQMRRTKAAFDPAGRLSPGTLFDPEREESTP